MAWSSAFVALLPQLVLRAANAQNAPAHYSQYTNLFLGTANGGNMFPGVVPAPFSMVKLGPDVESGTADAYSGYLPSGQVWGFSMMHESGTGVSRIVVGNELLCG